MNRVALGWRRISPQPLLHRDRCSDTDLGNNIELVHQQFCAGQTHSKASASRVAVSHSLVEIPNTRSLIARNNTQTSTGTIVEGLEYDFAVPSVLDDVAR